MALKLKPEVKNLWIEALNSDEYQQGHDYLTTVDTKDGKENDCCLGVLCKLAIKNGVQLEVGDDYEADDGVIVKAYGDHTLSLPPQVVDWAFQPFEPDSLDGDNANDPKIDGEIGLSLHNDGYYEDGAKLPGKDFSQIAGLIQEHL